MGSGKMEPKQKPKQKLTRTDYYLISLAKTRGLDWLIKNHSEKKGLITWLKTRVKNGKIEVR